MNQSHLGEFQSSAAEIEQIYRVRERHLRKLDQPLILISQIQRSGGTLLTQLFDGHPDLYVHPHELKIGKPKSNWPDLDLGADAGRWFESLFELSSVDHFRNGYEKAIRKSQKQENRYPFVFLPNLQANLFSAAVKLKGDVRSQRDVLDCYMTSYFNAWLDNPDIYSIRKYILGFTPRVTMAEASAERFFRDYPDGFLVSIVREPKSWYWSAHAQSERRYPSPSAAMALWNESADATLRNFEKHRSQMIVLRFEALLAQTENVMKQLCDFLGISFHAFLIEPTFQGMKIHANSSFPVGELGLLQEAGDRSGALDQATADEIESISGDLYRRLIQETCPL